jgi:plastocyanin
MTNPGCGTGISNGGAGARAPAGLGIVARRHPLALGVIACLLAVTGGFAASAAPDRDISVSQRGRMFTPGTLSLKRGQTVHIVNDDYDLLHHAYIESETFNFDSGDQQPGTHADIVFSVAGDFKVLCGIHPKMKLLVHVE